MVYVWPAAARSTDRRSFALPHVTGSPSPAGNSRRSRKRLAPSTGLTENRSKVRAPAFAAKLPRPTLARGAGMAPRALPARGARRKAHAAREHRHSGSGVIAAPPTGRAAPPLPLAQICAARVIKKWRSGVLIVLLALCVWALARRPYHYCATCVGPALKCGALRRHGAGIDLILARDGRKYKWKPVRYP